MTDKLGYKTLTLPLSEGRVAVLMVPYPITDMEWLRLRDILIAMQPGLTVRQKPKKDDLLTWPDKASTIRKDGLAGNT